MSMNDLDFYELVNVAMRIAKLDTDDRNPDMWWIDQVRKDINRLQYELDYRVNRARLGLELEKR